MEIACSKQTSASSLSPHTRSPARQTNKLPHKFNENCTTNRFKCTLFIHISKYLLTFHFTFSLFLPQQFSTLPQIILKTCLYVSVCVAFFNGLAKASSVGFSNFTVSLCRCCCCTYNEMMMAKVAAGCDKCTANAPQIVFLVSGVESHGKLKSSTAMRHRAWHIEHVG